MKRLLLLLPVLTIALTVFSVPIMMSAESMPLLVASFTDWEPLEMQKAKGSWWYSEGPDEPGEHLFYYLVEEERLIDQNHHVIRKGGQEYSSFSISEEYPDAIHHPWRRDYFNPVNRHTTYYSVSVPAGTEAIIFLIIGNDKIELDYSREFGGRHFYRTRLTGCSVREYHFEIVVDADSYYLGSNGIVAEGPAPFLFEAEDLPVLVFDTPEWSKGAVVYQIFPERFHNGNPLNDPPGTQPWDADPMKANLGNDGFFGGDLEGVIDKLDYLYNLGVDAIYLNPIFESVSSHKYDTTDYMRVDPHVGDDMVLQDLIYYAELDDIGIILDGVFNHSGTEFWAFQDVIANEKDSEYVDWFFIRRFPIRSFQGMALSYDGWSGYAHMPKLNVLNPELQDYFAGVVEKYGKMGISGWRLDVAGEVRPKFWQEFFRPSVKEINSEAILVGELWGDSRAYLREDMFDSVTNYLFRDALFQYVLRAGKSAERFVSMTNYYLNNYPPQVLHSLWNLLGSHDTERAFTAARHDLDLMKIMVGIQMTFVGSPVIYYGDEIGMSGGGDPDCRRPMIWDEADWNTELFEYYNLLIDLRREHEALRTGDYSALLADGPVLIFSRSKGDDCVIVVVNPSDEEIEVPFPVTGEYRDYLDRTRLDLFSGENFVVEARSLRILVSH